MEQKLKNAPAVTAAVTLAMEVDAETKTKIEAFCKTRGASRVEYTIDKSILGGVVIQIGDDIYDGSLLSRVEAVRQSI